MIAYDWVGGSQRGGVPRAGFGGQEAGNAEERGSPLPHPTPLPSLSNWLWGPLAQVNLGLSSAQLGKQLRPVPPYLPSAPRTGGRRAGEGGGYAHRSPPNRKPDIVLPGSLGHGLGGEGPPPPPPPPP